MRVVPVVPVRVVPPVLLRDIDELRLPDLDLGVPVESEFSVVLLGELLSDSDRLRLRERVLLVVSSSSSHTQGSSGGGSSIEHSHMQEVVLKNSNSLHSLALFGQTQSQLSVSSSWFSEHVRSGGQLHAHVFGSCTCIPVHVTAQSHSHVSGLSSCAPLQVCC